MGKLKGCGTSSQYTQTKAVGLTTRTIMGDYTVTCGKSGWLCPDCAQKLMQEFLDAQARADAK